MVTACKGFNCLTYGTYAGMTRTMSALQMGHCGFRLMISTAHSLQMQMWPQSSRITSRRLARHTRHVESSLPLSEAPPPSPVPSATSLCIRRTASMFSLAVDSDFHLR